MNKIIGGLVVATLLSNPSITKNDLIAYRVFQAQSVILAGIRKEQEEREPSMLDVDDMLEDIDKNSREINTLLQNKYDIFGKIKSILNLKAYTKTVMSDYQIDVYCKFNECYCTESENINKTLNEIEKKHIESVKKEIFRNESNFTAIYKELKTINDCQYDAIFNLNKIIDMGCKTLAVI